MKQLEMKKEKGKRKQSLFWVMQWEPLQEFMDSGKPVWGTCAGLILCAKELTNPVKVHMRRIEIPHS